MQDSSLVVRVVDITTGAPVGMYPAVHIVDDDVAVVACGAADGVSPGVHGRCTSRQPRCLLGRKASKAFRKLCCCATPRVQE